MRFILVVGMLFFSLFAQAQASVKITQDSSPWLGRLFYNPELRYERGETQEWAMRSPVNIAIAIKKGRWAGLLEVSRFSESTGSSANSMIERKHEEILVWIQRDLFTSKLDGSWDLNLYGGAGLGAFQEEVKTTFMSDIAVDKSKPNLVAGLSGGAETVFNWRVNSTLNWALILGAEMRILAGQELDPNPQLSGLARIGLQF